MARKICNHPVFPSLRAKLTDRKINVCSVRLIRFHIFDIAEIQAALEHRGGVFASRATAVDSATKPGQGTEWDTHRALVKQWRVAKINLYNDLCFLEALRDQGANKARWELQLAKAFELWKEVEIECSRIPGYLYAEEDDGDIASAETTDKERDAEIDCRLNEGMRSNQGGGSVTHSLIEVVDEVDNEDHGVWQTVQPKGRAFKQLPCGMPVLETSSKRLEEIVIIPGESTGSGADARVQKPVNALLQEVAGVTSSIGHGSYWDCRNRYDLLREIGDEADDTTSAPPVVHGPTSSPSAEDPIDGAPGVAPAPPLAQPSLKRKSSRQSAPKRQRFRSSVHMGDTVVIICDNDARSTTGLPPEQRFYKRPHFSYTTAETARRRLNFYRRSSLYVHSTWTLSKGYENVNTSHYKTPWDMYDALQRLNGANDIREAQEKLCLTSECGGSSKELSERSEEENDGDCLGAAPVVQPWDAVSEKLFTEPESER